MKIRSTIFVMLSVTLLFMQIRFELEKELQEYKEEQEVLTDAWRGAFSQFCFLAHGEEEKLEADPATILDHASESFIECSEWNDNVKQLREKSNEWYGFLFPDYSTLQDIPIEFDMGILASMIELKDIQDQEEAERRENELKYSSYTIYLDGNIVDYNSIDINHYKITIDDEKKCIFLSRTAH